ncbi:hypothetical protein [Leptolyngbya sp. PCC 6406]|uniref:hypothetical protein n=1 Tax=Leptolyngbya sp. PCC 6406 TaxID=1173264 RepID=UPI0021F1DFE8|nr:hypothetical protein [Leptolyngbya sp. PCC 6406]
MIILIDIFILVNVFTGLHDISAWHLSPSQAYPCYSEWSQYRTQTDPAKDYNLLRPIASYDAAIQPGFQENHTQLEVGHLGEVSETCLKYAEYQDQIATPENQQIIRTLDQKYGEIVQLENANSAIRSEYDSTLLEELAGQPRDQSINTVDASQARQTLDRNLENIAQLQQEMAALRSELVEQPTSQAFLAFVQDEGQFQAVEAGYDRAAFWYPSIQLSLQGAFLLPLIVLATALHGYADRRRYGLLALMSWHLLAIFFIPLVFKIFEFLQVGVLFELIFSIISALLGGLLFLVSYVYILLIPLVGFGIIKFCQQVIFNPRVQAANRVQNSRCIRCAKKIRHGEAHCPHCGYEQHRDCPHCHRATYKYLPYCIHCGESQLGRT